MGIVPWECEFNQILISTGRGVAMPSPYPGNFFQVIEFTILRRGSFETVPKLLHASARLPIAD
ncbi:hypothetical protein C7B61_17240 [filamentous cyanobacterium CCP1]|nr:hypothetical protein C7B76_17190 [filamentous cyanobacterium CCP2]PSB60571.1 hypothetical protein C7B61_17240 [filamentous cyanobacterium CCP1]